MRKRLSLLMGLPDNASPSEMRKQYQRIMTAMLSAESELKDGSTNRYAVAREKISEQYERVRAHTSHAAETHTTSTNGVLLGEILVEAGIISREQLDDALMAQCRTQPPLPLGRILVSRKLITWEQLAYFLKLQDLIQLSPTAPQRMTRQFVELGLVSRAELEMAEVDCETTGCSLGHILIRRGWIKASVISALTSSPDQQNTAVGSAAKAVGLEKQLAAAV